MSIVKTETHTHLGETFVGKRDEKGTWTYSLVTDKGPVRLSRGQNKANVFVDARNRIAERQRKAADKAAGIKPEKRAPGPYDYVVNYFDHLKKHGIK